MGVDQGERPPGGEARGGAGERPPGGDAPGGAGEPRPAPEGDHLLGLRNRVIVGVVFFALYAGTFATRGNVPAGLVGGALGGLLFYLILKEADERRKRRLRR